MRIFVVFPRRGSVYITESQIWLKHIIPSLTNLGHDIVLMDYDYERLHSIDPSSLENEDALRADFSQSIYDQVVQTHNEKPIDLFFSYLYSRAVESRVITDIRSLGILTLNFSCNNAHQFSTVEKIAPLFDYCMVPERQALQKFQEVGARPIHVQMGANQNLFQRLEKSREDSVVFVGTKYADRAAYLSAIVKSDVSLKVWGPMWQRPEIVDLASRGIFAFRAGGLPRAMRGLRRLVTGWGVDQTVAKVAGPALTDEAMVDAYNTSAIALNFSKALLEDGDGSYVRHIRMRDFEIPMTGILGMLEFSEELEEYYDIGTEVVTFETPEDLADKARYYMKHERERVKIAEAGYQRAIQNHTWEARFRSAFLQIGLGDL